MLTPTTNFSEPRNADEYAAVRASFEREGWCLIQPLLDEQTVRSLVEATRTLELAATRLERDTLVRGVYFEMQSLSGRKGEPAIFPGALRKITSPSKGEVAFAQLRKCDKLLRAIEGCGVAGPGCLIDQINFKLPRVGTCFPYHQDENFLFGEALERVRRHGGVNVVIALDPMSATNGGFEVLGRTHQSGLVQHAYDASQMNAGTFDESLRVVPTMAPGDALLFHPRLAHGSGINNSDHPRRLVTLWFGGGAKPSDTRSARQRAPGRQ